jgi:hypothetical protein
VENRPDVLPSETIKVKVTCGSIYIHICYFYKQPFEIFINMSQGGNCLSTRANSIGKMMSIALRESPLENRTRMLTNISAHLVGSRCSRPVQDEKGNCIYLSCEDAIGQSILKALSDDKPKEEPKPSPKIFVEADEVKKLIESNTRVHGPCPVCHVGFMITQDKTPCPTCNNPSCHYKECD